MWTIHYFAFEYDRPTDKVNYSLDAYWQSESSQKNHFSILNTGREITLFTEGWTDGQVKV